MSRIKSTDVSLIIPCYNESHRIQILLDGIAEFDRGWDHGAFELLIVDDGSQDDTPQRLQEHEIFIALRKDGHARLLRLEENHGKGAALQRGVMAARHDYILTLDADMATHPLELEKWLELTGGTFHPQEILIGCREHRDSIIVEKPMRKLVGNVFNFMVRHLTPLKMTDTQCGFKLYPQEIARYLFHNLQVTGWAHDVELLYKAYLSRIAIKEMPVNWHTVARSKICVVRDSMRMLFQVIFIAQYYKRHQDLLRMFSPIDTP